ncbi:hypothetical protein MOQ72_36555 [Saccharopolyspora sp. K220]|uniref:hypothetical protein n=1 Tax=Saccharopolyspora soli TaxID=2926618 RepID=UPI001F5A8F36|nr:hypothetical protein [Saccharopolyspora soli]MCI2422945.1 hypothetical protein [Saccharopolyspora soli]
MNRARVSQALPDLVVDKLVDIAEVMDRVYFAPSRRLRCGVVRRRRPPLRDLNSAVNGRCW